MARGLRKHLALVLLPLSLAACAGARTAGTHAAAPRLVAGEPNGGRSPVFSPDGSRIAFLSSTLHTPPDLWVMSRDGAAKRRLTTRGVSGFQWSQDGRAIHAVVRRKGYEEVLTVDLEKEGREERFTGLPPNASLPAFSPDGSLFAFTAPGPEGIRDLWVGTADRTRVEPVTEKIHVRSFFWAPDGRRIGYEPGKTYGLGVWEVDLATMAVKPLVSNYIGTPSFSAKAGRIAYPYPTNPGEFEVHTMNLDGTGAAVRKAPHLTVRWLAWANDGSAVYYLGRDPDPAAEDDKAKPAPASGEQRAAAHAVEKRDDVAPRGTSLWRLDLETGAERRVSPEELHVVDFSLSADGGTALVTGVLADSRGPEIFRLDLGTGSVARLTPSRSSAWMPVPSPDATRVAYVTNEGFLDAVRVSDLGGTEIAAHPGFALGSDARVSWLPRADALLVFSERGLHAFSEKSAIAFANAKDHRALLYADVSLQDDKIALSAIPKYGESPGLYLLEAVEGAFVQTDLRFPPAGEEAAEQYVQPRWSVDGKRIAFTDGIDVWTMNADGTARRRLTAHAEANVEGNGAPSVASFPVWSVRGHLLAYTLTVYGERAVHREIWVADADGSSRRRLYSEQLDSQFQVFLPEYTSAPFFDPSDRRLIATAVQRGVPNVISIDLADGKVTALTETGAVFPAMLPEEDSILYTSLEGNDERIWIMDADGTGKRPFLTANPTQESDAARASTR